jgi:hypothetical protein
MNHQDIIRMSREACDQAPREDWNSNAWVFGDETLERFAALVAATERNKLAAWMMSQGYATGHGDSIEKLLEELEWQIEERIRNEREECAKACDVLAVHPEYASDITKLAAQAIRARGNSETHR